MRVCVCICSFCTAWNSWKWKSPFQAFLISVDKVLASCRAQACPSMTDAFKVVGVSFAYECCSMNAMNMTEYTPLEFNGYWKWCIQKAFFSLKHDALQYLCLNCLFDDDDVDDVAAPSIGAKEISAGIGGRRSSNDEWLLVTVARFTVDHLLHRSATSIASDKLQILPLFFIDSKR